MNALVPINKLPVELLTYIIRLANKPIGKNSRPYLSYTWVCSHWQLILVQTSAFWTLIHHRPPFWNSRNSGVRRPFDDELLRRSGSAKLDVILSNASPPYVRMVEDLFAKNSTRIRNLEVYRLHEDDILRLMRLIPSQGRFPSLRGLSLNLGGDLSSHLQPILSSDHLETLELSLREDISLTTNQLALIFGRIRNLKLTVSDSDNIPFLRRILHNSVKVQQLWIQKYHDLINMIPDASIPDQVTLPELHFLSAGDTFLLNYVRAPKLSTLDMRWYQCINTYTLDYCLLEGFDFPLIKYLHIQAHRSTSDGHHFCILGSKQPIHCESFYSAEHNFLLDGYLPNERSRNSFHLRFGHYNALPGALQEIALLLLPRLKNLIELHLLYWPGRTITEFQLALPELQFLRVFDPVNSSALLESLQAPKLSRFELKWQETGTLDTKILTKFDFSSIKYLYLRGPQSLQNGTGIYCILGSTEQVHCQVFHSHEVCSEHSPSPGECPRDCFHLTFESKYRFNKALRKVVTSVLPRLTSLVELYILFPLTLAHSRTILAFTPTLEKVFIQRGSKLLNFIQLLSENSICPRLKHLSFTTYLIPRDVEKYAEDVGKTLTSCLQSRQENSADGLKNIILRNCPPLPVLWLNELQNSGAEVITENNIKDIIGARSRSDKEKQLSDIEV